MGCGNSNNTEDPELKNSGNNKVQDPSKILVKTKDDFNLTAGMLVQQSFGKISKNYRIQHEPIGKGAFGEVRKAIHKISKQKRAIKIILKKEMKDEKEQKKLREEVTILSKMDHPNIIKVYEFYEDEHNFYIIQELCTGGELFERIINNGSFNEQQAAQQMKCLLSAIVYCHKYNIVHRDLKPENLLYESSKKDANLKVIDWGTSKIADPNEVMKQKFGTPYYIAPEVLEGNYTEKCDIWSLGVILYIMLCGYPPFNGQNDRDILKAVKEGHFHFPDEDWEHISEDAKDLILMMLRKNYKKRISGKQALEHPWIRKNIGKIKVSKKKAKKVLSNMQNFTNTSKLQQATWVYLVSFMASKEEKEDLLKIFQALDTNADGQLSREELMNGFEKIMGAVKAKEKVDLIMKSVDTDGNDCIDYSEFVTASIDRKKFLDKDRLKKAFQLFDQDGSNQIELSELKRVFKQSNVDDVVWKQMIHEIDENSDGQISFDEFEYMMMKIG